MIQNSKETGNIIKVCLIPTLAPMVQFSSPKINGILVAHISF